ncbi:NAD(P)-binding protein, partial [Polyplosphaeria fusca]
TLSYLPSSPLPSPPPTTHLLAVHSTAITNGELTWAPYVSWPAQQIPCYDVSGTILTPVSGSPFSPGDRVFGRVDANREGTAREYAEILPSEAAHVPRGLGMVEAAVVPMSGLTAWQGLFEKGELCKAPFVDKGGEVVGGRAAEGKRVLVLGAAGGVGIMAVQFARIVGAKVVGTASGRNKEFLEGLGAEVVDYTKVSMKEWVGGDEERRFDVVFDCVGGKSMLDGWNAIKKGGMYVSVVTGFREPEGGKPEGARTSWFIMKSRGEQLEEIAKFIEKGLVKGAVDSVWKLEEWETAFAKTATGHARGKVVLKI